MDLMSGDEFLGLDDLGFEDIQLANGKCVRIKQLSEAEFVAWENFERERTKGKGDDGLTYFRASLVAACAVNEKGEPLFSRDQIEPLAKKSHANILKLGQAAFRLNVVREEDRKELEKN